MSRIRQIFVAAGTFSVALGIGFVMQNGDVLAARFGGDPVAPRSVASTTPVSVQTIPQGVASAMVQDRLARPLGPTAVSAPTLPDSATAPINLAENDQSTALAVSELSAPQPVAVTEDNAMVEATIIASDLAAPEQAAPQSMTVAADLPATAPETAPVLQAAIDSADLVPQTPTLETPAISAAPEMTDAPSSDATVLQVALNPTDAAPSLPDAPILAEPACDPTLTAIAMPAAMVDLNLIAPCAPETRVTIHHQGMMFSVLTDASGMVNLTVPALAENAVFMADVGADQGAVAIATVPDLATYDRAVLQWQGLDGPEIHALEFGASYNDQGHVWHGAARTPDTALAGTGGFLVRLGDGQGLNPLMAEVYTYPSGQTRQSGIVAFSVETPVTETNCGSELQAQTIQVSPGAQPFALDLDMAIPACDAVGQYLVLKNMLLDLTLAAK